MAINVIDNLNFFMYYSYNTMLNYYEILEVDQDSSFKDIKKSFRRKAKEIHPDLQSSNKEKYEEKMKLLLKAYNVLGDPKKRDEYDRLLKRYRKRYVFNYHDFLRERKDDPFSQARLIFYDLLNLQKEEALDIYESFCRMEMDLENYLSREDFMDCTFLLAEAYAERKQYVVAFELYKKIYRYETEKPYFHHFIDEIVERIRDLVCFRMINELPPETILDYLHELVEYNFSNKDTAFFYKKIAEVYSSVGNNSLAAHYLNKGLSLNRKLAGVKKLKEKIGFTESSVL